ncbi:hypothetical protein PAECIP111893_03887 [Paenibacillus plantiphilus]|uniref:Nucleotidyltransferase family protein n=1 Tax=Paenibacillus plantiphilus TaxID=2905650 RepID=A0ABM9CJG7_9BACL|nr:nucleotidyltransferase family protein [Paenibacillus plantiphilus]CAH1215174.1 hypothetical protein PAECIP111893_03887 [Paenibacillus plantiphilus]
MLDSRLKQSIMGHDTLLNDLRLVRELGLPQCYIAAGYIRNYIWDELHGFANRKLHNDIDVIYFDREDLLEERDQVLEQMLIARTGNDKWSVKNQARMHVGNGDQPYHSTEDAISKWPETATAIGVKLNDADGVELCCPYGLEDLYEMVVRRSPLFMDRNYYRRRVNGKGWKKQWPLLTIIEE